MCIERHGRKEQSILTRESPPASPSRLESLADMAKLAADGERQPGSAAAGKCPVSLPVRVLTGSRGTDDRTPKLDLTCFLTRHQYLPERLPVVLRLRRVSRRLPRACLGKPSISTKHFQGCRKCVPVPVQGKEQCQRPVDQTTRAFQAPLGHGSSECESDSRNQKTTTTLRQIEQFSFNSCS